MRRYAALGIEDRTFVAGLCHRLVKQVVILVDLPLEGEDGRVGSPGEDREMIGAPGYDEFLPRVSLHVPGLDKTDILVKLAYGHPLIAFRRPAKDDQLPLVGYDSEIGISPSIQIKGNDPLDIRPCIANSLEAFERSGSPDRSDTDR